MRLSGCKYFYPVREDEETEIGEEEPSETTARDTVRGQWHNSCSGSESSRSISGDMTRNGHAPLARSGNDTSANGLVCPEYDARIGFGPMCGSEIHRLICWCIPSTRKSVARQRSPDRVSADLFTRESRVQFPVNEKLPHAKENGQSSSKDTVVASAEPLNVIRLRTSAHP